MRTGLITRKLGMSAVFAEDGSHIPVTILKLDNCQVVSQRTKEKDGYTAVQLGVGLAKVKNVRNRIYRRLCIFFNFIIYIWLFFIYSVMDKD